MMTSRIRYQGSAGRLRPEQLSGFFVGWTNRYSSDDHLRILENSGLVEVALDEERVVGFVTCITDGIQSAFIPLLEVLPDYQGRGIGTELVRRLLARLEHIPAIDVMCDADVQPFYERLGMRPYTGMVIRR